MKIDISFIIVIAVAIVASACGDTTEKPANVSNVNVVNANATQANSNTTLEPIKKPDAATTNNAPTLGPVVQAYYDGLRKKDDAMVKGAMTEKFVKTIEEDMKAEGKKGSIAAFMAEVESDLDKPVEVRNEKIDGNMGVAEIKGGAYINWTPFEFTNEGGKWKFTGGSPVLK